jgi:hypothetical protein
VIRTQGARAGDRFQVWRHVSGQTLRAGHARLGHARLDADGKVGFVTTARATRTTYVVRLLGTKKHSPASAKVTVPRP